jgi:hypothetical protein
MAMALYLCGLYGKCGRRGIGQIEMNQGSAATFVRQQEPLFSI